MALQAGVPTRDSSHTERNYKSGPYTPGNGPVLPRRSSKGIAPGGLSGSPSNGNTPLSSLHMSGSPYNIEGGPLSSSEERKEREHLYSPGKTALGKA